MYMNSVKCVICANTGLAMWTRMGKGSFKRLVALARRQGGLEKPVFNKVATAGLRKGV